MSIKEIPAKKIITCDCCLREVGSQCCHRNQNGGLHILRDLLDFQGAPCANGSMKFDLCDSCLSKLSEKINEACAGIRAAAPSPSSGK